MKSLAERIGYTLWAAALGILRAAAVMLVALAVVVVVTQALLHWYATGTFTLFPAHLANPTQPASLAVTNATPAEAATIRKAVARLRFRLPAGAVGFGLIDQPPCPQCGGDYAPYGLIQLTRGVVDQGGPALDRAVAHEVGHFVDTVYLTDVQRAEFMRLRGMPGGLSWQSPNLPWERRPVEDFAEVFAFLNVTAVDSGPQTAYGPVRDPKVFERLLASAGVRLGRESSAPDVRKIASQEIGFARDQTANPYIRLLFTLLIALYIVFAGLSDGLDAWRRHGRRDSQAPGGADLPHADP